MQTTYHNVPAPESEAVKVILQDALEDGDSVVNDYVVEKAIAAFNCEGPFYMAKRLGLLVNNSGEDMAIEFMSFVNQIFPNSY
jgi:hypothetical protein